MRDKKVDLKYGTFDDALQKGHGLLEDGKPRP